MITYKIQSGDTLTSIADRYNTSVDELVSINGISNRNLIYAGDTLSIPDNSSNSSNVTTEEGDLVSGGGPLPVNATRVYDGVPSSISSDVSSARDDLDSWRDRRPDDYSSSYTDEINSLVESLLGMEFSYDMESDPLFSLSRDQYLKNARLAMEDTLGKATAMTGGYGNSYALGAAQQAYNNELSGFSELIPELYEAAYDRFSDERETTMDSISILSGLDEAEFEKYIDIYKEYISEGELYSDNLNTLLEEDFDRYIDYSKLLLSAENN